MAVRGLVKPAVRRRLDLALAWNLCESAGVREILIHARKTNAENRDSQISNHRSFRRGLVMIVNQCVRMGNGLTTKQTVKI